MYELVAAHFVLEVVLAALPVLLVEQKQVHQVLVVLELGVDRFDVRVVLPEQQSCVKRRY